MQNAVVIIVVVTIITCCLLRPWEDSASMTIKTNTFASKVTCSDYRYTRLGHSLLFYTPSTSERKIGYNHPEKFPLD